jgi:hypothetical protein
MDVPKWAEGRVAFEPCEREHDLLVNARGPGSPAARDRHGDPAAAASRAITSPPRGRLDDDPLIREPFGRASCACTAVELEVDAEPAKLDDRGSTPSDRVGGEGQHEWHSVGLAKWLAVAQHAVVPWRRLDGEADSFKPSNELANVLSHPDTSNAEAASTVSVSLPDVEVHVSTDALVAAVIETGS